MLGPPAGLKRKTWEHFSNPVISYVSQIRKARRNGRTERRATIFESGNCTKVPEVDNAVNMGAASVPQQLEDGHST